MVVSPLSVLFLLQEEISLILLHLPGFLGSGQETGAEETLPFGELAHFLFKVFKGSSCYLPVKRSHRLLRLLQLVSKDALAETDKITMETAKLPREDYLAPNTFTPYDKVCPFYKSVWILRNIIHFYNLANQAV